MSYEYAIKRTRTGEILYEGMGLNADAVSAIMREFEEDGAREGAWRIVRRPRPCQPLPWEEIDGEVPVTDDISLDATEDSAK